MCLLWIGFFVGLSMFVGCSLDGNAQTPVEVSNIRIQNEYKNKIVYAHDEITDQSLLKEDCRKRGGRFNTCGSMCDDSQGQVMCAQMCVNTCEFK